MLEQTLDPIRNVLRPLDSSKFFAGIVMLLLNIGAKHFSIKLSETQEDLLKYSVARELVIFAMAWVATRDIVTSILITAAFVVLADFLLNDDSCMCVIPKDVIERRKLMKSRLAADGDNIVTPEEERKAIETLERARKQKHLETQVQFASMFH